MKVEIKRKNQIILCQIDEEDFKLFKKYKWYVTVRGYITRDVKGQKLLFHRMIMNCPAGMYVDHIDGDPTNNKKENLRIVTHQQNMMNKMKRNNRKYKGVYWQEHAKKWRSSISVNQKRIHIGYFNNPVEAAMAYNTMAIELHGEYAKLNIINED